MDFDLVTLCTIVCIGSFSSFLLIFSSSTFRKCRLTCSRSWTVFPLTFFLTFTMCKLREPSFSDIATLWLNNDKYLKPLQLHFTNPVSLQGTFDDFPARYTFFVLWTMTEGKMTAGLSKRSNTFLLIISACKILG